MGQMYYKTSNGSLIAIGTPVGPIQEGTNPDTGNNGYFFYDTDATDTTAMTLLSSTTDNGVPRFDGTGGLLQTSAVTISDAGQMTAPSLVIGTGVNQLSFLVGADDPTAGSGTAAAVGSQYRQTSNAPGGLPSLLWIKDGANSYAWTPNFEGRWISYTPSLTASTTNPTGWTQTGYYTQIGKTVIAKFTLTAGASMTAGSGFYRIAFPVAATGSYNAIGSVFLYDNSSSNAWTGAQAWHTTSSTYFEILYAAGGAAVTVAHDKPWANWAANDYIRGTITYEAA